MCSACVLQLWSLTSSSCQQVIMLRSSSPSVNPTTLWLASPVTETLTSLKTSAQDTTSTPSWPPGKSPAVPCSCCFSVVQALCWKGLKGLLIQVFCSFFCPNRKTFPSQHATLSAFAAVYVSVRKLPVVSC